MDTKRIEEFAEATDAGYAKENPLYYVLGIGGEAGEVLELFKKSLRTQGVDDFEKKLKLEIGDLLWYIARIANQNNLTIEECWEAVEEKLTERHRGDYYK